MADEPKTADDERKIHLVPSIFKSFMRDTVELKFTSADVSGLSSQ